MMSLLPLLTEVTLRFSLQPIECNSSKSKVIVQHALNGFYILRKDSDVDAQSCIVLVINHLTVVFENCFVT